jgi:shikimate kinase
MAVERIYLVGFMGVGKSTIGKKLAHKLNFKFIDLDDIFEEKYKISIDSFFQKYDEKLFRKMEHDLLLSTFDKTNVVVSTGGGTPCYYDAMDKINRAGVSIYIKMLPSSIAYRLSEAKRKRPLIGDMKNQELLDFITKSLKKREPVYKKALMHVNGLHINIEELVEKLEKEFKASLI